MIGANASPEKRLFISLITRDISLVDAVIDLTDNCVNAAMKHLTNSFASVSDFDRFLASEKKKPTVTIDISFDETAIRITDDASGIDFQSAKDEVFRFGHSADHHSAKDRLSVYGIGMKRAMFKIGDRINITSDHKKGGFALNLNVTSWARDSRMPWEFPILRRAPTPKTGTRIHITRLHEEIQSRIDDGRFESDLIDKLSRVYSYFIDRLIKIRVNGTLVAATPFEIGSNFSHDKFQSDGVSCNIVAGIAKPDGDRFVADASGWFIFCNFRTVVYADKTQLTGWGGTLPQFQPKHRPFLGLISFTSPDPEALPWTTTKGGINEDSLVWQEAKARLVPVAKPIIRFLDKRYTNEGTEFEPAILSKMSGEAENVFSLPARRMRQFTAPKKTDIDEVSIQYKVKQAELQKIRKHFARSSMSASEAGRITFDYFLDNEVD